MTIAEILKKYAKKGDKLYSPMFGVATFKKVDNGEYGCISVDKDGDEYVFNDDGTWNSQGEPILFPSREQRDWDEYVKESGVELPIGTYIFDKYNGLGKIVDSGIDEEYGGTTYCVRYGNSSQWTHPEDELQDKIVTKFDVGMLKPFDRVLVRIDHREEWRAALFSHFDIVRETYWTANDSFGECVPYNDDTKHLVGTCDDAPEFYQKPKIYKL